jgi:hypothetical protein
VPLPWKILKPFCITQAVKLSCQRLSDFINLYVSRIAMLFLFHVAQSLLAMVASAFTVPRQQPQLIM